jgi:hypothetical protein
VQDWCQTRFFSNPIPGLSGSPDMAGRRAVFFAKPRDGVQPESEKIFSLTPGFMKNIFLMKKYFQTSGRKSARRRWCFLIL